MLCFDSRQFLDTYHMLGSLGIKVLSAVEGSKPVDCNGTDAQAQQVQANGDPRDRARKCGLQLWRR